MATGDFLHYKVASPSFKFMGLLVGINPRLSSRLVEDWFSGSSVEYKGTTFGMGFLKARRLIGSIGTRPGWFETYIQRKKRLLDLEAGSGERFFGGLMM
ncbi:hypothetical protein GmHk_18G051012 [Glycine max]|nr:hypothetical protein GmHk_18G051012 [Glycine max]